MPPIIPRLNEDELKNLYEGLQSKNCQSTILNIIKRYNEYDSNRLYLSNLYEEEMLTKSLDELQATAFEVKINITEIEADTINTETVKEYKSRKWFLYRANQITASSLKSL